MSYDSRILTVQFLSLYNQRILTQRRGPSWTGDWIYRRDRLNSIDLELRNTKPDILFLNETMHKAHSPFESDEAVLKSGALSGFTWQASAVRSYEDSAEIEELANAVGPGFKLETRGVGIWPKNRSYEDEHFLQITSMGNPDEEGTSRSTLLVNVFLNQFDTTSGQLKALVDFLTTIKEAYQSEGRCQNQMLIAMRTSIPIKNELYNTLLANHRLVDASSGKCQSANDCYTATPQNELFLASAGDRTPEYADRIIVPESAIIYESGRNFVTTQPNSDYSKKFGLGSLTPVRNYGWKATVRLAKCPR